MATNRPRPRSWDTVLYEGAIHWTRGSEKYFRLAVKDREAFENGVKVLDILRCLELDRSRFGVQLEAKKPRQRPGIC